MGNQAARSASFDASGEVNFDHFQILRAIGKGSFGKVCIVQKKDTNKMYAMKYMNKAMCAEKEAIKNVLAEVELLQSLEHPFLVNLWFTFDDEEDLFMVVDLLLGGDLRYHLQKEVKFTIQSVRLFLAEICLALDYLRSKKVLHRDLKPDNILMDEDGHYHITDFNVATSIEEGHSPTSVCGTRPYMAPEVFEAKKGQGYSYSADWWSLGICTFEILKNRRPYDIHSNTTVSEFRRIITDSHKSMCHAISSYPESLNDLVKRLLETDPEKRLSSLKDIQQHEFFTGMNFDDVLNRKVQPPFIPSKDHLNCDPTFELEEMIVESKPLHKKKKRLAKQNSKPISDPIRDYLESNGKVFEPYDRERKIQGEI
ncbi:DgyrCDS13069 [Dimorphilus gyrociliatus]|uniref:DgyrCDS13069 n=1 Tax=Dimorphilus gyrociliatus TaxID=2664684 RepID=A0A7I8W9M0_9ANNE|nr:DgyrCDS13069 [Dimorphilus gyrociliatus]